MPKISVIVPVWNVGNAIKKTIESLLNQTLSEIEIILVNDGSTDNSEEILKNYSDKFSERIKVITKKNGGLSSARNEGVKNATGDYIAFVDGGDYVDINLFKNLEPVMNKKVDVIKFKMNLVDENGKELKKIDGPIFEQCSGEEAFLKLCVDDTYLEVACIYLYNREFFIKNNFKYDDNRYHKNYGGAYHEDFGLTPIILMKASSVVSTKNFGYYYVQDSNSITRNTDYSKHKEKAEDLLIHYDNMIDFTLKNKISNKALEMLKSYYTNVILLKIKDLNKYDRKEYKKKIKERKMIKNIKVHNIKQLIKKIILSINMELFCKLK